MNSKIAQMLTELHQLIIKELGDDLAIWYFTLIDRGGNVSSSGGGCHCPNCTSAIPLAVAHFLSCLEDGEEADVFH